jgi:phage N-6-adenine-methyltransferase
MSVAVEQLTLTGPSVKRGQSEQVVSTPWEFIYAVERKFGPIAVDLAATAENRKARRFISPEHDTFKQDWTKWLQGGLGWLNPEFDPMVVSVRKCALEQRRGAEFVVLSPASISTNWFWDHVQPFATVYSITPRICFEGSHNLFPKDHPRAGERKCDLSCVGCAPYPKDLMLSHYCANPNHELQRWKWK